MAQEVLTAAASAPAFLALPFRVVPVCPTPTFRGAPLPLLEAASAPPRTSVGGHCVTGLHVWPSTLAALRHLESLNLPQGARYLDISAGAGLLALGLAAAAGAAGHVTATELPSSLPLLHANAATATTPGAAPITACAHTWGAPLPPAAAAGGLHLAVACDVLHCAIRDGAVDALAATLAAAALAAEAGALVVWEVRSGDAEAEALGRAAHAGGGALEWAAPPAPLNVAGLLGRGVGHPDGEIFLPPSLLGEEAGEKGGRVVLAATLRRR